MIVKVISIFYTTSYGYIIHTSNFLKANNKDTPDINRNYSGLTAPLKSTCLHRTIKPNHKTPIYKTDPFRCGRGLGWRQHVQMGWKRQERPPLETLGPALHSHLSPDRSNNPGAQRKSRLQARGYRNRGTGMWHYYLGTI